MKQARPLEPLITALLAKDPAERPSAEDTELALRSVAEDTEPRAWTASVPPVVLGDGPRIRTVPVARGGGPAARGRRLPYDPAAGVGAVPSCGAWSR